jgi:hypothetical protein
MKRLLACLVVMSLVPVMTAVSHAATNTTQQAPAARGQATTGPAAVKPGVPALAKAVARLFEINKISHDLRRAMMRLQQDTYNYGGHRVKALQDLNAAVQELNQALASINNKPAQ